MSLRATVAATFALLFLGLPASPCHVPDDLRHWGEEVNPPKLALMAMGHETSHPIPYQLAAPAPCVDGMADIFPCQNVDLVAFVPLSAMGGGAGNDVWGWTDPVTGKEYALVGRSSGLSVIDLSNPESPVFIGNLRTHTINSSWRDVKVYADHAFVVADFANAHGLQVLDLRQLRNLTTIPATFNETAHYAGFGRSHNVAVNVDTGYAYALGSDTCNGGLHMIDIQTPAEPRFAGCFSSDGYTHDTQCVVYHGPDTQHVGKEICFSSNEDTVTIVDVTNKSNPVQLSRSEYAGSGYTHQGWLTEDHRSFVHDDEADERIFGHNTRTYVWDVSNLDAPTMRTTFTADGSAIDHNQYVRGRFTYQGNYRRGLRILDLQAEGGVREVGYLDTYPEDDGLGFDGAWSTYPFFNSGIVLVSDINRGLFIVRPHLEEAIFNDGFESGDLSGWGVQ